MVFNPHKVVEQIQMYLLRYNQEFSQQIWNDNLNRPEIKF